MVKEPPHGLCPLRHRKGQYVKMMVGKTQLQQTKSNLSSKTKCCKKGKGGTTRFGGLDEGADDTSDQSAKAKPFKTVTESEQDFCSQSGEIVDIFKNQLETIKPKSLQHGTMTNMLERKQAKQQKRVLFEQERCAQRKAW